jgi:hypothetical protein
LHQSSVYMCFFMPSKVTGRDQAMLLIRGISSFNPNSYQVKTILEYFILPPSHKGCLRFAYNLTSFVFFLPHRVLLVCFDFPLECDVYCMLHTVATLSTIKNGQSFILVAQSSVVLIVFTTCIYST